MRHYAISATLAALFFVPARRAGTDAGSRSERRLYASRRRRRTQSNERMERRSSSLSRPKVWPGSMPTNRGKGRARFHRRSETITLGDSNPPGLYRTLIYNRPFEIVQTPGKVVQLFEWAKIWRVIWTDGRPVPDDLPAGPYWYGYSVGVWRGIRWWSRRSDWYDRAWLDEWGTPFSGDARIEERWKRTGPDRIELTITLHDPATYAKPWDKQSGRLLLIAQDRGHGNDLRSDR